MTAIEWAYDCYYCGKQYVRVSAAYKHRCKLQPRVPLHHLPVFLIVVKKV